MDAGRFCCSDDSFIDFRAGLIAQGRDWYEQAMTSPDSLAGHPAVAGAGHPLADNPLFYEEVNYAASRAFERVSGDENAFWDALKERGPRDRLPELGEDFDFDDDQEMRRRLPRLFRSSYRASRNLSSTAWLTAVRSAVGDHRAGDELYAGYTHPPRSADHRSRTGDDFRALPLLRRSRGQSPRSRSPPASIRLSRHRRPLAGGHQ